MLEPRQGSFVASLRGDFGPSPDFQALAERLGLEHTYTPDDEATFAKNACARGQWTAADQWRCQGPVHLRLSGSATGDEASIEAKALLTVTFPRRAGGDWAVELTVEHEGRLFVDRVSFPSDRCRVGN